MRHAAALAVLLVLPGCAYFNGVYNARQAERAADRLSSRGREAAAATFYVTAATKAETVLVRHPRSRWRSEALYLAGRGWALANECDRAVPLLDEYLALANAPPPSPAASTDPRAERARLALGICRVRLGDHAAAREILVPLVASRDRQIANESAIWTARTALASGDTDGALAYLRSANAAAAEWELAAAYLRDGRYVPAESLLALRAKAGDFRHDTPDIVARLWREGREESALRLITHYERARLPSGDRARLHLTVGDLMLGAGRDSAARAQLQLAHRAARDSVVGREAAARLTLLEVRDRSDLVDIETMIARAQGEAAGTALAQRLADNLLLLQVLAGRRDTTGASLFLAAEVARDSLRARSLAQAMFARVGDNFPTSHVAPKALLAASAVAPPDAAASYLARLRRDYPSSAYTRALDGVDGVDGVDGADGSPVPGDRLLEQAWSFGAKAFADTLAVLRRGPPPGPVAATNSQSPAASPVVTPPLP
ncbi:MAG: hypothetical protein M3373_08365 [Gemmatimonadota bacterium]|nr:hypothetical protein [Gemmatimonadota bacterium]